MSVDWSKTVMMFPGQGSQVVGMGKDFAAAYPVAQETFNEADDILGFKLSEVCFEGPKESLDDTVNTQPALYVCSMAILRVLQQQVDSVKPLFVAGHSLGELTALTAAGALSFADGVRLVRERGRLMKQAGEENPGAMAAILGLSSQDVRDVCNQASQETARPLVLANDNCPGQVVISGDTGALDRALTLASDKGARRAVKLAVSIAAHSPLMQTVADDFRQFLDSIPFEQPHTTVYANVTAAPLTDVDSIRHELAVQLTQPVRWTESIQAMIQEGATTFVEVGAGDVLAGLVRRIDRKTTRVILNSVDGLQQFTQTQAD